MRTRLFPAIIALLPLLTGCVLAPAERQSGAEGDVVLSDEASEADEARDSGNDSAPASHVEYGPTYNSNCYCLGGMKYCDLGGTTYKSGTCP